MVRISGIKVRDKLAFNQQVWPIEARPLLQYRCGAYSGPRQGNCKKIKDTKLNIHILKNNKSTISKILALQVYAPRTFLCAEHFSSPGFFAQLMYSGSQIWRRPATGDGVCSPVRPFGYGHAHEAILKTQLQRHHRLSHPESNYKV